MKTPKYIDLKTLFHTNKNIKTKSFTAGLVGGIK